MNEPGGRLFGEPIRAPGERRVWFDWEYVQYASLATATVLLVVGLGSRPGKSFKVWRQMYLDGGGREWLLERWAWSGRGWVEGAGGVGGFRAGAARDCWTVSGGMLVRRDGRAAAARCGRCRGHRCVRRVGPWVLTHRVRLLWSMGWLFTLWTDDCMAIHHPAARSWSPPAPQETVDEEAARRVADGKF